MPATQILLHYWDSPTRLGIVQAVTPAREILYVITSCCLQNVCWASNSLLGTEYWACSNCKGQLVFPEGKAPSPVSKPVFELEDKEAVHKWNYAYLEEIHTWVAQWTGLGPKTFDLDFK